MKAIFKFDTYNKLLLLIIGTSICFFILSLSLYYYIDKQENQFFQDSEKQFNGEIEKLLDLKSAPLLLTINNDTNWDEFVEFMITKDKKWYDETIGVEVNVYNVDYMAVYDVNKHFVINTPTAKIKSIDFMPQAVMFDLDKTKLNRFYLKIPEGIVVVYGASIHPSTDTTKKRTKSSGYFFMVRLLDNSYLKNLEKITDSKIILENKNEKYSVKNNTIVSKVQLTDFQNKSVGTLVFERKLVRHFDDSRRVLFVIVIAFLLNLIVYLIYVRKWIHTPLVLITRALKTGNRIAIRKLKKISGEYNYIGNLFEENQSKRIELEIAKTKAEENNKLKSVFLANLSHEIRTPMNAIVGFSDLLSDASIGSEEKSEYLKIIKNSGNSLVSIIEDLIEMSKIDANQTPLKQSSIDLQKFIFDLYTTLKITIPVEKQIDFQLIATSKPAARNILIDEVKLKQILTNLITNAIKYTNSGFISLEYNVNEKEGVIDFSVKDSGIGIKKSNLVAIFDRFQRVESDYAISFSGLGLGLAISKAYVELLSGTINVKSKIGVGSDFSFAIPLKYDDATKDQKNEFKTSQVNDCTSKTILIAEDNNLNFVLLKKIVELKGHHVLRAENGKEAIDICLNNSNVSLVFMDIKMPILDGYEALKAIKAILPDLPIVAQTAYSSPEDFEKLLHSGFDNYITKPLDRDKIYELMAKIFQS